MIAAQLRRVASREEQRADLIDWMVAELKAPNPIVIHPFQRRLYDRIASGEPVRIAMPRRPYRLVTLGTGW